ncbi:MAG: hypothetical protein JSV78_07830 [Phycisphaerales bacterium]|nr:MAG: hypothetical protein JSV78_07830 [Phycisphaerales bacterium]
MPAKDTVTINRAPVLTLWAAVVAEVLGFERDTALTLGKAVAGLNAQAKGRSLGIFRPPKLEGGRPPKKHGLGEEFWIELCGRSVPAKNTEGGVRAVVKDKPISPDQVRGYLERAFGEDLAAVRKTMEQLAKSREPDDLAEAAFALYEKFRPTVAGGRRGWGQKGELNLKLIRSLAGV